VNSLGACPRADEDDSWGMADGLQFIAHGTWRKRGGGCREAYAGLPGELEPVKVGAMRKGITVVGHGS